MAINLCTVSDKVFEADGSIPEFARVRFELIGWDSDQNTAGTSVIAPEIVFADVDDLTGEFAADLWQNGAGLRGTFYKVALERYDTVGKTGRPQVTDLGKIQIEDGTATADLSELLSAGVTTSGVWVSAITESDYNRILYLGINEQTSDYTLVADDFSKMVEMNVGSANTLTIPADATVDFETGTQIIVAQTGTGQTTIAGAAGVTVNSNVGLKIAAQWESAVLIKRAANSWIVFGALVS
jgi:hypothetical protein